MQLFICFFVNTIFKHKKSSFANFENYFYSKYLFTLLINNLHDEKTYFLFFSFFYNF